MSRILNSARNYNGSPILAIKTRPRLYAYGVGVPTPSRERVVSRIDVWLTAISIFFMLQAHMKFPPDYPYSPPSIRFMTKVWHPNVYEVSEYIRELSIPRIPFLPSPPPLLLLPVSTLSSPCRGVYVRVLPVSLCVPFPFIRLSPRLSSHRITTVPLSLSVSASLYLPPSAAIAFTTISFYIVTFSACETIRVVRTLRPVLLSSKRNGEREGERGAGRAGALKKKKRK